MNTPLSYNGLVYTHTQINKSINKRLDFWERFFVLAIERKWEREIKDQINLPTCTVSAEICFGKHQTFLNNLKRYNLSRYAPGHWEVNNEEERHLNNVYFLINGNF